MPNDKKPPFFHVVVEMKEPKAGRRLLYFDLTEKELKNRFVRPYRRGSRLLLGGETLDTREMAKVQIVTTPKKKDSELESLRAESRRSIEEFNRTSTTAAFIGIGHGWSDEEVADVGSDVTSQYLTKPAGSTPFWSAALHSPWVLGLGTTVIGGALVALFAVE